MQDTLIRTAAPARPAVAAAPQAVDTPFAPPRFDMYLGIHKGLRLFFGDTIARLGSTDPADDAAVAATLAQARDLFDLCELHYDDEDRFVHPAIERVQPGATEGIVEEHKEHYVALDELRALARVIDESPAPARGTALARLYRALALYAAEDFEHMHFEDTEFNALLWRHYGDAELIRLHDELVATIPPEKMFLALRWMIPALNAPERAAVFIGARHGMPVEAFRAALNLASQVLPPAEYKKLALAIDAAG